MAIILTHYFRLLHEASPPRRGGQRTIDPPSAIPFEIYSIMNFLFQDRVKRSDDQMSLFYLNEGCTQRLIGF